MVETAVGMQCVLKNNMESKKYSFEAYLQKMQRHFEQNSKIREVQAHSSKVRNGLSFVLKTVVVNISLCLKTTTIIYDQIQD